MPLESLLTLAETLKGRISSHGETIGAYEIRTRCALIDPLLSELGWDVSNPTVVVPEYALKSSNRKERVDYALLKADGTPAMMVEAKRLGLDLRDGLSQGIGYCVEEGTKYLAVTDGARWEIYETHSPVPIDKKRIVEFDLSADPLASVCLNALALWRPSVESGSVEAGQPSVIELDSTTVVPPPPPPPGDWHRFTDTGFAKGRKPAELQLPDNTRTALKGWFSLLLETTRWLSSKGHLTEAHCPIIRKGVGAKRYIVHTESTHSDGKEFTKPVKVNGLFVNKHPQVRFHFGYAKTVIEHVGQAPSQFRVRFRD